MGAGRNIGGGPGGEAPGYKGVLGDLTGIFTHLPKLKMIILLNEKLHGILSFRKILFITFPQISHELSDSINLMDSSHSHKTIKTERTNATLSWTQTRM